MGGEADPALVQGGEKASLLRALFAAGIRMRPVPPAPLAERRLRAEAEITASLRPPDERERVANLRHAVSPLFAAIVES